MRKLLFSSIFCLLSEIPSFSLTRSWYSRRSCACSSSQKKYPHALEAPAI